MVEAAAARPGNPVLPWNQKYHRRFVDVLVIDGTKVLTAEVVHMDTGWEVWLSCPGFCFLLRACHPGPATKTPSDEVLLAAEGVLREAGALRHLDAPAGASNANATLRGDLINARVRAGSAVVEARAKFAGTPATKAAEHEVAREALAADEGRYRVAREEEDRWASQSMS